jgi:hypothetical protein
MSASRFSRRQQKAPFSGAFEEEEEEEREEGESKKESEFQKRPWTRLSRTNSDALSRP